MPRVCIFQFIKSVYRWKMAENYSYCTLVIWSSIASFAERGTVKLKGSFGLLCVILYRKGGSSFPGNPQICGSAWQQMTICSSTFKSIHSLSSSVCFITIKNVIDRNNQIVKEEEHSLQVRFLPDHRGQKNWERSCGTIKPGALSLMGLNYCKHDCKGKFYIQTTTDLIFLQPWKTASQETLLCFRALYYTENVQQHILG